MPQPWDKPKTLYDASISYITPSGRKVRFNVKAIAAWTLDECEAELRHRLKNAATYGRRRYIRVVDDFSCSIMGTQIQTR